MGGETQRVLPADMEGVNVETGRSRTVSQKAIQNAIQTTLSELTKEGKTLKATYETTEKALSAESLPKDFDIHLSNTKLSYTKYKGLLEKLKRLLEKDKWGELSDKGYEHVNYGKEILDFALKAINNGTDRRRPSEVVPSLSSRSTHRSGLSRTSSTLSTSARRKDMAEAAAAKKKAEFDRIIAVIENYMKRKKNYA